MFRRGNVANMLCGVYEQGISKKCQEEIIASKFHVMETNLKSKVIALSF